jgi:uncharacterized protein
VRKLLLSFAGLVLCAQYAAAADVPASEKSIHELIAVTQMRAVLDNAMAQIDSSMKAAVQQATAGQPLNPKQQQIMDDMQTKMVGIMKEGLNWDTLEPMLVDHYRQSFSQREVDGMLKFYATDAGKAIVLKLPVVMQRWMVTMQEHMKDLMPKLQQLMRDTTENMKAASTPAAPPAPPGS